MIFASKMNAATNDTLRPVLIVVFSVVIAIFFAAWSASFIVSVTSFICLMFLLRPSIVRKFKSIISLSLLSVIFLLTYFIPNAFDRPFHERAKRAAASWEKMLAFYQNQSEQIALKLSSTASSPRETQNGLSLSFENFKRTCISQGWIPPAGIRLTDKKGNTIAWVGMGFSIRENVLDQPEKIVTYPAGSQLVFSHSWPDGFFFVYLPIEFNSLESTYSRNGIYTLKKWLKTKYSIDYIWISESRPSSFTLRCDAQHQLLLQPDLGTTTNKMLQIWSLRFAVLFSVLALISLVFNILKKFHYRTIIGKQLFESFFLLITWIFLLYLKIPDRIFPDSFQDPRLFAGFYPFSILGGELLFISVGVWLIFKPFHMNNNSPVFKRVVWIISPVFTFLTILIATKLSYQIINNCSYAWWPSILLKDHFRVLILPVSSILILAAVVRFVFFLYQSCFNKPLHILAFVLWTVLGSIILCHIFSIFVSDIIVIFVALIFTIISFWAFRYYPGNSIVLSFCALIASSMLLSPLIDKNAAEISQSIIQSNVTSWVNDRDQLRRFALESNLVNLSNDSIIHNLFQKPVSTQPAFPAYNLWKKSDLSAITESYGIEILDSSGNILDRFIPGFNPDQISPAYLNQLSVNPNQPVVESFLFQTDAFKAYIMGGISLYLNEQLQGYLIIFLAAGPLTAIPGPLEWGHNVIIKPAFGGKHPQTPTDFSLPIVQEKSVWKFHKTQWIDDKTFHRKILIVPLPEATAERIPFIIASLPKISWHARTAGGIRLLLLSLIVGIPSLLFQTFNKRFTYKKHFLKHLSFKIQLLIAFWGFSILLPLVLSFFLREIFREDAIRQEQKRLHLKAVQCVEKIFSYYYSKAEIIKTAFSKAYDIENPLSNLSGKWIILDSQGQIISQKGEFRNRTLPWETIVRVFNTGQKEIFFFSKPDGELKCRVVLPLFKCRLNTTPGTILTEFTITQNDFNEIYSSKKESVSIYINGKLHTSSQMDLSRTGFLPDLLDHKLYEEILSTGVVPLVWRETSSESDLGLATLRDEYNTLSGILTIRSKVHPVFLDTRKTFDLLLIITVTLLLAGVILAIWISRKISLPLMTLTEGAKRVAQGVLDQPVKIAGGPELIKLAETFNQMMSDISLQRKRLQQRHEFISTLLQEMSSGIIAVNSDDVITTINPRSIELLNLQVTDPTGLTLKDILKNNQLKPVLQAIRDFRFQKSPRQCQCRFLEEGVVRHLKFSFSELKGEKSRQHGILIVIDDISSTIRSTQMEAYSDLARRVAHEIKNPLTPIQLSIEHLRQTFLDRSPDFPEIFDKCTSTVLDEVRSLRRIATEFSQFSRFPKPLFRESDLRSIIVDLTTMVKPTAEQVDFLINLPEKPVILRLDEDQIKRALLNIIQNAVQAMPEGGVLTIELHSFPDSIEILIKDTGIGMDEETQLHLFEPYFSTKQDGIGLGLVITKATIDAHGGRITVKSAVGAGTTFTIKLPRLFS